MIRGAIILPTYPCQKMSKKNLRKFRKQHVYCLRIVFQLGFMEAETSPQILFFVCFVFLLFGGWDRESVCVKVLILVSGSVLGLPDFERSSGCGLSAKPR